MADREKVIKTIQNRINEARNKQLKVATIFVSTLSDILDMLKGQPQIVRCKDCKHRPKEVPYTTAWNTTETYLDFPDDSECPCQCSGDTYYSWNPDDDWFCGSGKRRTD